MAGGTLGEVGKDKIAMPRKYQVDPLKDTLTWKQSVRGGGRTLSDVLREDGTDLESYIEERKAEMAALNAAGITVDTDAAVSELGLATAVGVATAPEAPA